MALAGDQLLLAHGGLGGDGEDQIVDRLLAVPVVWMRLVADHGVRLVSHELEGTGADRLLVQVRKIAALGELVGIFLREDGGEVHGQVGDERRFRTVQHELHRVIVHFLDGLHQVRHGHAVEILPRSTFHIGVVRMVFLKLTVEREQHVVGVEVAARREEVRGVELHTLTQLEGDLETIVRNLPALCQARNGLGCARLELDKAVVDRLRRCVECGARGIERRVEAFRASFRAIDKRLCACRAAQHRGGQQRSREGQFVFH